MRDRLRALDDCEAALRSAIAAAPAMTLGRLAVNGQDLINLGMVPGKALGKMLNSLLSAVLDGTLPNEKTALLAAVPALSKKEIGPVPKEIERKFLIRRPDETMLATRENVIVYHMAQTYLLAGAGTTERVRCRESNGETRFFHTVKRRLSELTAEESEQEIDETAYRALLLRAEPARRTIYKTRYAFPYRDHLMEVDIYPFWEKQAVLEIELGSETESYSIPPFLSLLREVTADYRYKNASLAKVIVPEETD